MQMYNCNLRSEDRSGFSTCLHHMDSMLLARLWPRKRVIAGLRTCKWIREVIMQNSPQIWLQYRRGPEDAKVSAGEVARNLKLLKAAGHVELTVQTCSNQSHVTAILQGVLQAWELGWQGGVSYLDLCESDLGNGGLKALLRMLRQSGNTLSSLKLGGCTLGKHGSVQNVALLVRGCHSLSHLDLGDTGMFADGAEALAVGAGSVHLQAMSSLILDGNRICDDGAWALSQAVVQCRSLRFLSLRECAISDHGARALAEALAKSTTLQELDLSCNHVGEEGAQLLRSSAGECAVYLWANEPEVFDLGSEDEYEDEDCYGEDEDMAEDYDCLMSPGTERARWRRSGGSWTRYSQKKAGGW